MTLVLKQLTVERGSFQLGPISIDIDGGVCALIGANGAGKTTLLGAAGGILAPTSGSSEIAGHRSRGSSRPEAMRALGFLPQNTQAHGLLRVSEAVSYAAWLKGMTSTAVVAAVREALHKVELAEHATRRVGRLSGGQRQRVCIAQAIVHRPSVLLLDEPTVGLDPVQRTGLYRIIEDLAAGGATIVLSTHNLDDVTAVGDRVVVLRSGQVVADRHIDRAEAVSERFAALNDLVAESMGLSA